MSTIKLDGGGLECILDARTGRIVGLTHVAARDEFVTGQDQPGGLEVYDELKRVLYSDLRSESDVSGLGQDGQAVRFVKHFAGAPFELHCRWQAEPEGLSLEVDVHLTAGAAMRSVRISLVLPTTGGLVSWTASYPPASDVLTNPVQYCYLADERGKARTGIPMLSLYHPGGGGLSLVMPLELPKVQLNMGVEPADPRPWYVPEHVPRINAGAEVDTISPPGRQELGSSPVIRFTEKHVGLRPDKPLRFGLWLFGHQPHWRVGLGKVVERYRDYFEPHPAALPLAGGYYGANPATVDERQLAETAGLGFTHAWFHGHFEFHGEFLTDEALAEPGYRWLCEPYPQMFFDLSLGKIRSQIELLTASGIGALMYGFNMHCDEGIIAKRGLGADVARSEDGQIARSYHDQPVMFFGPGTAFGDQQLRQAERLMRAYPRAMGLALDNWNYAGIDFGHDDGITMVNSRPAANINFSQQRMIGPLSELMHRSGRFIATNKGRTIESLRGVDFVLTESQGVQTYATFAYLNMSRNVCPCEYDAGKDARYAEDVLKYVLVWGGQMGPFEPQADIEQARAYQPLISLLRNRRWVFQADPLSLPELAQGQIFQIDPRCPFNGGSFVVTLTRPEANWRTADVQTGRRVSVRLAEAGRLKRAQFLGVQAAGEPIDCRMGRSGETIEIELPPLGSAGVLRLS